MDFLNQIKMQLAKMSETEKDEWILNQSLLLAESEQEGILLSLFGKNRTIDMPTIEEIDKFCEKVKNGEIYFEYETHYYEFDDNGRYMNCQKAWHNDLFEASLFLNRVFAGCHNLLGKEEYQIVLNILDKVFELQFSVKEAKNSEHGSEKKLFSLPDADKEGMFFRDLSDVGSDWIRAFFYLSDGQDNRERARKLINMFEHPAGQKVRPMILLEKGISRELLSDMTAILERDITELESCMEKKFQTISYSHEKDELQAAIERKKEILLDIRENCLKTIPNNTKREESKLAACWEQISEEIKWLSYEPYIDDQLGIDEIQNICEALIRTGELEQEDWELRKKVLTDIIQNEYYDYYGCGDVMEDLAQKLCTNKEEYLACADIMDESGIYKEKAAYLYHQYGMDEKYVSYLASHLGRGNKEYSELITYYQEHNQQENARCIAEQGMERCQEDLTDIFICLLSAAQKDNDQKRFQKLYTSAKRRKRINFEKINNLFGS